MGAEGLIGKAFGRWVAISVSDEKRYAPFVICQCKCGCVKSVNAYHLYSGSSQSCGCARKDTLRRIKTKHGHSPYRGTKSRAYRTWKAMIQRCQNRNDTSYKNYGGRGITVCESWLDFRQFVRDMGNPPEGCSIERIDNDGNYEPSNCRWATQKEQCSNQRTNWQIKIDGTITTAAEASRRAGFRNATLYKRLYSGGFSKSVPVEIELLINS